MWKEVLAKKHKIATQLLTEHWQVKMLKLRIRIY